MDPHPAARSRALLSRPTFWIGLVLVLLLTIPFAITGGLPGVLLFLGLVAIVTGVYTSLTKRRSWVGLPSSRRAGAIVLAAGLVVVITGAALMPASLRTTPADAVATPTASSSPTATPTASVVSIDMTSCENETVTQVQGDQEFTCTTDEQGALVWMTSEKSTQLAAARRAAEEKAAQQAAADKLAAQKAAEEKAAAARAAERAAAEKLAAQKAAEEKAAAARAAEKAAAEKLAADQAAADKVAAEKAAADATTGLPPAEQPAVPQPPAEQSAPTGYVHPGAFCNGGAGVSKTGKAMVCAPGSDGRMRWRSAG